MDGAISIYQESLTKTKPKQVGSKLLWSDKRCPLGKPGRHTSSRSKPSSPDIHERLEAVNRYFKLKAADVFEDDESVHLLVKLYKDISLRYSEANIDVHGKALARLAAAGFCELGENRFQITESGKRFIESINESQD